MPHASPRIEPPAPKFERRGQRREVRAGRGKTGRLIQFCSLIAGILLFACILPGQVQSASGKQTKSANEKPGSLSPTVSGGTIHVASPLVVVPFTVTAPSGDFVYDLNENEVRVLDDGVPQRIRHFGMATQPTAAVVVVQANQKAAPFLRSVHPMGPLLSDLLLGSKGSAAVLTYSDKVALLETFSGDPLKLNKALQDIQAGGSKARLNDALARAVRMLATRIQAQRRVIIVFSDGLNHGSTARGEQVVRAASDANVQIYGLRFQPGREAFENGMDELGKVVGSAEAPPGAPASVHGGQTVLNLVPVGVLGLKVMRAQMRKNMLATYAGYTGGRFYTPFKKHSFQDTLQQIALDINSEYVLTYVPDTLKEEGFHRIQLEVSRPRVKVHTRSGYFYGAPVM